jgi:predicted lipoprotein with Yx(FWY)xxD motif
MSRSSRTPWSTRFPGVRSPRLIAALAAVAAAAGASGVAGAAALSRVVGEASNSTLNETVVIDTHGRTLYALHPASTHHLLCRTRTCLEVWPALTVRSSSVKLLAGHGVEGDLGLLRRRDGKLQVTLRGMALYRFSGDSAKGQANGEGIVSFGGTWHAVKAQASSPSAPPPTAAPPTSPPYMPPPYTY